MANVMGKEKKESNNQFAKGGSTKMFSEQGANPAVAGSTAVGGGAPDNKFDVKAGNGKMVGKQAADPQAPGVTGHDAGSNQKWGLPPSKGHMAGWTGAQNAKPA